MMKTSMKKMLSVILCIVLIAAMALTATGCGSNETPETTAAVETAAQVQFTFVVVDAAGEETTFDISTDKATVGEALLEEGLIVGEESEYGLYVKTVNGITADWDVDQTYWGFYIDGEYAMTGVDATEVQSGSTYTFKVEGGAEAQADAAEGNIVGEGANSFTFTAVDVEGSETTWTVNTDETTVGAALQAVGMIEGEMGEYGLYVKTVNGITLDWDKDQKYWAFYVDGEYAMTGVDTTEISADSVYTFKAE